MSTSLHLADAKLEWRSIRIGLCDPGAESSPAEQLELGLAGDRTLHTTKSEREKLRERAAIAPRVATSRRSGDGQ